MKTCLTSSDFNSLCVSMLQIVKPHKKRKLRVFDDPSKDRLADSYEIDYTVSKLSKQKGR